MSLGFECVGGGVIRRQLKELLENLTNELEATINNNGLPHYRSNGKLITIITIMDFRKMVQVFNWLKERGLG